MPRIWKNEMSLDGANAIGQGCMVEHLGIVITEIGDDYLKATMPVDRRTMQPMGLLHGGASVALAETLGSTAAYGCIDPSRQQVVGLEINANHVRAVRSGLITGTARPLHLGRTTQLWEIRIEDQRGKLVCISRLTLAILTQPDA